VSQGWTARVQRGKRRGETGVLELRPFAKQGEFHASSAKYRLFGGAAGPGKSKALLMEAVVQAHDHPGANTLLRRRTFPELEQSLLLYFRRDVPRDLYKSFNESKHLVTWWNGSSTWFGYCQRESDVHQYQGAEFLLSHRRADAVHAAPVAVSYQPQSMSSGGRFSGMAGATESRKYRARVGEGAVDRP